MCEWHRYHGRDCGYCRNSEPLCREGGGERFVLDLDFLQMKAVSRDKEEMGAITSRAWHDGEVVGKLLAFVNLEERVDKLWGAVDNLENAVSTIVETVNKLVDTNNKKYEHHKRIQESIIEADRIRFAKEKEGKR